MTDPEKLDALYRLYEKPLYRIALAILHDHAQAEDAVSEAFYRVIRHISRIGEPDCPETRSYMIRVIRSTAFRQYRTNQRHSQHSQPWDEQFDLPDPEDLLGDRIRRSELRETLSSLIGSLSETDRRIVVLHGRDGLPFAQIAQHLGMREAAVRKRYERARKRMTSEYQKGAEVYEAEHHK